MCASQGNALKSVHGLSKLTALTELDLRCNLFASYQEFTQLQGTRAGPLHAKSSPPQAYDLNCSEVYFCDFVARAFQAFLPHCI